MNKVFKDSGYSLAYYASSNALSICPNCGGPAMVKGDTGYYLFPFRVNDARVQCLRCTFNKKYNQNVWYGTMIGYVRQRYPCCGFQWLETKLISHVNVQKPSVKFDCVACKQSSEIKASWQRLPFSDKPYDPYFGLPLWLQIDCCGNNTLWAYNEEHLSTLKSYIEAEHRKRPFNRKWSMFTRLPQWIKSAKNRDELLRCIAKLERKLQIIKLH